MRKLALSDELLLKADKASRYIGGEINSVMKDKDAVDVRFCMCFPDLYEIGMSHLGIQILYDMFNRREDTWCERVYSPWPDMDRLLRDNHIPLFALESQDPVKDFDFLGITLQYEMCYTNILQILDLSQIPLLAKERTWAHPIVIGGGPCSYNPEPLADFFDLFYIGEGETQYGPLLELYKEMRQKGASREEFLHAACHIPGIYVPSLYEPEYHEDGTIAALRTLAEDVPPTVKKEMVMDFADAPYPERPIVPYLKATQDRVVLELFRGCIRGCRFCQAGMIYRPTRQKDVSELKRLAYEMMKNTGYDEISLSSLSSSDYKDLEELITFLLEKFNQKGLNISLPSLRIDAFSLDVMGKVQDIKKSSLTFAPEAGSQRMRNVINKGLTEDDIMDGATQAFLGSWNKVKFYFMLGLPGETEEDICEIMHLCDRVARLYYDLIPKAERHGKCQITASTSFFVPKPFTPFQWARMNTASEFLGKARLVNQTMKEELNRKSIRYNWHDSDLSILEGVFARGDRRLSRVLLRAYEKGCIFDSWSEYFHYGRWIEAFDECELSMDFYTSRERSLDEIFPWDFISCGVSKNFLKREWERAQRGEVTPNCREACSGCGIASYQGGVCVEH